MDFNNYDYLLPEKNLALEPAVPRDSSKLFVYNTKTDEIIFDHFYNLDKYLPENSFLVLNNTKVLPARVAMTRLRQGFGGQRKVVVLFLINELIKLGVVKVMVDRRVDVGDKLYFDPSTSLKVVAQKENLFDLEFDFGLKKLFHLLKKYGAMPIPPYLKKSKLTRNELIKKYQTIFARAPVGARLASAAAPTASLHFTDEVFKKIKKKGIQKCFVTLHVGLGTFAPISDKNIEEKRLHEEYYEVPKETILAIQKQKNEGKKLIAVGTTVVRTLESASKNFITRETHHPVLDGTVPSKVKNFRPPPLFNKTDLFILPPYDFKLVDIMITNFHLPKSSLMMLVEAFLQYKGAKKNLVELYEIAIKNNFRFYSFGDAILIL